MATVKECSTCANNGVYQKSEICAWCVNHDQYVPKSSLTDRFSDKEKLRTITECSSCEHNGKHQTERCLWCANHNHDQYVPMKVMSKYDCKYFGLRTIDKPCSECKKLCPYATPCSDLHAGSLDGAFTLAASDTKKIKYGVGELPYLGGPLERVHLFVNEEDADAYYNLVVNSCTKSKINVRIIKFTLNDEIKLKDGQKVED